MDEETIKKIVSKLKIIFPKVSIDEASLNELAKDAAAKATKDGFEGDDLIRAASYFAAHLAYVVSNGNQHVKKEQASVLSREYYDREGSDDYLVIYNDMLAGLAGNGKNTAYIF